MVLETHMKLCITESDFLESHILENPVPEICVKMLSANQIARILD